MIFSLRVIADFDGNENVAESKLQYPCPRRKGLEVASLLGLRDGIKAFDRRHFIDLSTSRDSSSAG